MILYSSAQYLCGQKDLWSGATVRYKQVRAVTWDGTSTISCLSSSRVHASWAGLQKGLPTPCHTILEAEVVRQPSGVENKQSLYRLLEHSHRPEILTDFHEGRPAAIC